MIRATQKALERCAREGSTWTRADLIANLGRKLPRRAGDPDRQAALVEELAQQHEPAVIATRHDRRGDGGGQRVAGLHRRGSLI